MVLRLVEENAKQRFELVYGYDPTPPIPKAKRQPKKKKTSRSLIDEAVGAVDAADVDDVRHGLATTTLVDDPETEITTELPLVSLPPPSPDCTEGSSKGEYFIRASQGHSLKLESTAHLTPVRDDVDGRARVGLMVHGTRWELWSELSTSPLLCPSKSDQIFYFRRARWSLPDVKTTHPPRTRAVPLGTPDHPESQLDAVHLPRSGEDGGEWHTGVYECEWGGVDAWG